MRWWIWLLVAAMASACLGPLETERMEQISLCSEICREVEEAIYAEGTSIVVATSNLRCRCYVKRDSVVATPEPTPAHR